MVHPAPGLAGSLVQEDADVAVERQRIASTPVTQLMQTESLILQGKREMRNYGCIGYDLYGWTLNSCVLPV